MGDTDGSSRAAQSAQSENLDIEEKAVSFRGLMDAISGTEEEQSAPVNGHEITDNQHRGMVNLRRKRLRMSPFRPLKSSQSPQRFPRMSWLRSFAKAACRGYPCMKVRWITPLGFVHLKDFALTHGFNGGGPSST